MAEAQSPRFALNSPDLKSLGSSLLLSVAGAAVAALTQWFSSADFGQWGPIVGALAPFLLNILRKFVTGPTPAGG